MGGILELPNRNLTLHKCSNMLIRYKIIHKNSAWLYVGKKTINFVYHGAHIAQDNGNQTKLHIGESQGKTLVFQCLNWNHRECWDCGNLNKELHWILKYCLFVSNGDNDLSWSSQKQSRKQLHGDPHPKAFTRPLNIKSHSHWSDIPSKRALADLRHCLAPFLH